ncbi:MAG: aspartate kinase, partial [Alphaproteobacteria bacterium]|nr:aspartate kinase [Alphaproteobacteria bacterium]
MSRIVMKFGGTSVANLELIRIVADRVAREVKAGHEVAVVVSAMSGETNKLVAWVDELSKSYGHLHDYSEYDTVVASGEIVTAGLTALALQGLGLRARSWQGWQIPIHTDQAHGKARITDINGELLIETMEDGMVPVIAGFQGMSDLDRVSTLGR